MNSVDHLDVVVAGLAVADIIGRPVDLRQLPRKGGLKLIESISLSTGGNVSNVGIDLIKLGFRVGAITRVGDDDLGSYIINQYRKHGMSVEGVRVDAKAQTSATIVNVGCDGERTFLHTRGCMKNFRGADILQHRSVIQRASLLMVGYLGLLPEMEKELGTLFSTLKEKSAVKILLDTAGNPTTAFGALKRFLPFVDYFLPSYNEAVLLSRKKSPEEIMAYFRKAGASGILGLKLGAEGCYIDNGKKAKIIKGKIVRRVIDTTGAGDAFVAGFIAAMLKGNEPFAAAAIANRVAASCVTAVGASTAIVKYEYYR
ncbi:MAG: carbohydrate kinase family protein [bacterium]